MPQTFKACVLAKLKSISALTPLISTSVFVGGLPQTFDLGAGSAITFTVPTDPKGHVLTGSDGTSAARVQFDAWSYTESKSDAILEAIRNAIDGPPGVWGDGSLTIRSVVHQDDIDQFEVPKAGTSQWTYHRISEYMISYQVTIPTLS